MGALHFMCKVFNGVGLLMNAECTSLHIKQSIMMGHVLSPMHSAVVLLQVKPLWMFVLYIYEATDININ